jgi:hypothetical protein
MRTKKEFFQGVWLLPFEEELRESPITTKTAFLFVVSKSHRTSSDFGFEEEKSKEEDQPWVLNIQVRIWSWLSFNMPNHITAKICRSTQDLLGKVVGKRCKLPCCIQGSTFFPYPVITNSLCYLLTILKNVSCILDQNHQLSISTVQVSILISFEVFIANFCSDALFVDDCIHIILSLLCSLLLVVFSHLLCQYFSLNITF